MAIHLFLAIKQSSTWMDPCQKYWRDIREPRQMRYLRNFHGGSLMTWAAFSYRDKAPIYFISHKMNAKH